MNKVGENLLVNLLIWLLLLGDCKFALALNTLECAVPLLLFSLVFSSRSCSYNIKHLYASSRPQAGRRPSKRLLM